MQCAFEPRRCPPGLEFQAMQTEESRVLEELAEQIQTEKTHGGARPRWSAILALSQMDNSELMHLISLVNATTPPTPPATHDMDSVSTTASESEMDRVKIDDADKTTVIIKGLAARDNIHSLAQWMDAIGFQGQYDFVYVPPRVRRGASSRSAVEHCRCFGFVNFRTPFAARKFREITAGVALPPSTAPLQVSWCREQGLHDNIQTFWDSMSEREARCLHSVWCPWVFDGRGSGQPLV
mmetsp:Transcript_42188/g.91938  ORF Transcript_42188/g.91938 Transcript_42188/m.91938 type:complete len:238 (-) Transcript_42188:113-826(-)